MQKGAHVDLMSNDVHAISTVLKQFVRELADPLFTFQLFKDFIVLGDASRVNTLEGLQAIAEVLRRLPPANWESIYVLFAFLKRVAQHSEKNKMNPANLATVFGPNVFRPVGELDLNSIEPITTLTAALITHFDQLCALRVDPAAPVEITEVVAPAPSMATLPAMTPETAGAVLPPPLTPGIALSPPPNDANNANNANSPNSASVSPRELVSPRDMAVPKDTISHMVSPRGPKPGAFVLPKRGPGIGIGIGGPKGFGGLPKGGPKGFGGLPKGGAPRGLPKGPPKRGMPKRGGSIGRAAGRGTSIGEEELQSQQTRLRSRTEMPGAIAAGRGGGAGLRASAPVKTRHESWKAGAISGDHRKSALVNKLDPGVQRRLVEIEAVQAENSDLLATIAALLDAQGK
jgi:RhoGAP domain